MRLICTLFLYILCSSALLAQTVLKYDLKEGDVFTVKQNAEQVIVQDVDGATHELTNTLNGILEFKVLKEKEESYQVALTFKDLNLKVTSSIQGELMNVKAKEVSEGDMQSQIFNSLLDTPVELTLSKTGDILEVIGGDSLVAKMANASGIEDEFSKNLMKKSLEKEFGSEALSKNYKQMTFIYTAEEVTIGDTWQNEYTGKLNAKNTWSLIEITDTEAIIRGKAEVSMNVTEAATTMALTGTQETEIKTDRASGFISVMTVKGESKGISKMTQMSDQDIPTTIKSTITYQLIKE